MPRCTDKHTSSPEQIKQVQNLIFSIYKSRFNIIRPPTRRSFRFFRQKFPVPSQKSRAYYMPRTFHHYLFVAQQPNSGLCHFIVEISISHTHTQTIVFLWTSDQLVAEASTCITQNKHYRRTSMPSAEFKTAIPALERPQTYALDRTATVIDHHSFTTLTVFGDEYRLRSLWLINVLYTSFTSFCLRSKYYLRFLTVRHHSQCSFILRATL